MIVILEEKRRSTPMSVCACVVAVLVMMLAVLNAGQKKCEKCKKVIDNY